LRWLIASSKESAVDARAWLEQIAAWTALQMSQADSGHDLQHVRRVVVNARRIAQAECADPFIVECAAWLHDCVFVPKNSPQRSQASRLAAERAVEFLRTISFPNHLIEPVGHCIHAHSFSAAVPCQTLEAQVVQDADRLEALGAIGLARCLMTGGSMQQRLYHPDDPFPRQRLPADTVQSVDHFFAKLLRLGSSMQTTTGKTLAHQRTEFLIVFLRQLADEIGIEPHDVELAIRQAMC
jgi:uncharacterized protein